MTKITTRRNLLSTAIAAGILFSGAQAQAADSITEAVKSGQANLSFRLRNEMVNNDDPTVKDSTDATTLKTSLNFKTGDYKGAYAVIQFDNVQVVGSKAYQNGNTPTIGDQDYTQVNQSYLGYKRMDTDVRIGQQRILLDNQRFVGGVGFRQNEQTYEALSITNNSVADTTIFAAYVASRSTPKDVTNSPQGESSTLLNVKYTGLEAGALTGYAYLLDLNGDSPQGNLDTYGARFAGKMDMFLYEAEAAMQNNNSADADTVYLHLVAGVNVSNITAKLGYESMGSDDGKGAFSTPYGTNHKFNGWTDVHLGGAGANGLNDTYLSVGTNVSGVKLVGVYHNYEANEGSTDLGSEFGLLVAKKFDNYGLSVNYSAYSEGDTGTPKDRNKLWLTATAKY